MAVALSNSARAVVAASILFFISLFMTAYSARNPAVSRAGYAVVGEVQRPFQLVTSLIQSSLSESWSRYVALTGVRDQNEVLIHRVARLEALNSRLLEYESENQRLRSILVMKESSAVSGVVAHVIGYDPSTWQQAVIVDRGTSDGIEAGAAVLEGNGLVGQVTSASAHSSRVLLITDPLSGVDAIIQGSRTRGVLEGEGGSLCRWKFVVKEEEVRVGDRVITSGMDGIYPKGLLIGVVLEVSNRSDSMFHTIRIKPAVDFARLETVLISLPQTTPPPSIAAPKKKDK